MAADDDDDIALLSKALAGTEAILDRTIARAQAEASRDAADADTYRRRVATAPVGIGFATTFKRTTSNAAKPPAKTALVRPRDRVSTPAGTEAEWNPVRWSWRCYVLQEDGTNMPPPHESAETVPVSSSFVPP